MKRYYVDITRNGEFVHSTMREHKHGSYVHIKDALELEAKLQVLHSAATRLITSLDECHKAVESWSTGESSDNVITTTDDEWLAALDGLRDALKKM